MYKSLTTGESNRYTIIFLFELNFSFTNFKEKRFQIYHYGGMLPSVAFHSPFEGVMNAFVVGRDSKLNICSFQWHETREFKNWLNEAV